MMGRAPIGAILLCALLGAAEASAGDWIADAKTGCKVWNPQPSPGETISWQGECRDGFAAGKGHLDWVRGGQIYERDEGQWQAGRQTGAGTQSWPRGSYTGQLNEGLPHGHGVLEVGSARYEGTFLQGVPNGQGTLTNPSGTFSGTWAGGCFNDGKRRASFAATIDSCP